MYSTTRLNDSTLETTERIGDPVDDGGCENRLSSRLTARFSVGTYVVVVEGYLGGAGLYELRMQCGASIPSDVPNDDETGYIGLIGCEDTVNGSTLTGRHS